MFFWFPQRFLQVVDRKPGIPLEKGIFYRKPKKPRENQKNKKTKIPQTMRVRAE